MGIEGEQAHLSSPILDKLSVSQSNLNKSGLISRLPSYLFCLRYYYRNAVVEAAQGLTTVFPELSRAE